MALGADRKSALGVVLRRGLLQLALGFALAIQLRLRAVDGWRISSTE
jgi:hypothetical protein